MYNSEPYNVFLAISTNIAVLLMTYDSVLKFYTPKIIKYAQQTENEYIFAFFMT